ncbi:MAG: 3'-5' exonuclease, partial [Muribaculaceae bacterium]|nr:3'-5' exonuclease [Muribaculaceae bacterium]
MELQLTKPIIFFDLETTGVNFQTDRIVELSYIKVKPNGTEEERSYRVNPGIHIPEEASAIHHITDADVADKPKFREIAK